MVINVVRFRLTIWNVKQQEQQLILPFLANVLY
nr:MAG TPA: hypothetical protein [Caudoviricetes sp.]